MPKFETVVGPDDESHDISFRFLLVFRHSSSKTWGARLFETRVELQEAVITGRKSEMYDRIYTVDLESEG